MNKWDGKCPHCGSDEPEMDSAESTGVTEITAEYICGDCDESFIVIYHDGWAKQGRH